MPTRRYLRRLEIDAGAPPTLDTLFLVHDRHLAHVPYENLGIMLGLPPSVDPETCLDRIGRVGRAGYCLHQNAALELVLSDLGFAVRRRHAHVWQDEAHRSGPLNHLALEVTGLPTAENPAGRWWADVGLGEGFRLPLPLVDGEHVQDGFRYRLSDVGPDGWSFRHDPAGSFAGIEVTGGDTGPGAMVASHAELSAPGEGRFARLVVVQRRDASGIWEVRGCLLRRVTPTGATETVLASYDDWRAALTGELRVPLDDLPEDPLRELYARSWTAHLEWAAGRSRGRDE
jgi:N-hydroxyarylamine O-acetyltransferase